VMPRKRLRIVSLVGFLDWNLTSKTGERGEEVNEAITFGDAAYIQSLANTRLAELLTAGYADANIYPGGLMGGGGGGGGAGTHVIWVLIDKPSEYGLT
jgi:hypothetical protein